MNIPDEVADNGILVRVEPRELASVADANLLVTRGLWDLNVIQEVSPLSDDDRGLVEQDASVQAIPFDVKSNPLYAMALRLAKLRSRVKEYEIKLQDQKPGSELQ